MKRIFLCLLSLLLLLSFAGCNSGNTGEGNDVQATTEEGLLNLVDTPDTTSPADSSAILNEVSNGTMQGVGISLGTGIMKAYSEIGEPVYENFATTMPSIQYDGFALYYEDSGSKPVTSIVNFQNVYGFMVGASNEKNVTDAMGEPNERKTVEGSELYFMPDKSTPASLLTYRAGDNALDFYFINDYLVAAVLQKAA